MTPHAGLCPLAVLETGRSSGRSGHNELFAGMASQGLWDAVPPATAITGDVPAAVALEQEICRLSGQYLETQDYLAFAVAQSLATASAIQGLFPRACSIDRENGIVCAHAGPHPRR